jgi:hypothetical protein
MISTFLIAVVAMVVAVLGCAFIAPTSFVIDDGESAQDDVL